MPIQSKHRRAWRGSRGGMIFAAACLSGFPHAAAAQAAVAAQLTDADAAEAEAQRFEAAAQAMRQKAAALKQLEAANLALAAAQVPATTAIVQPAAAVAAVQPVAAAPGQTTAPPLAPGDVERVAQAVNRAKENEAKQNFGGLEFGVGISFTLDTGTSDRISDAELVNNIVRVSDVDNGRARIMLESHYFFKPTRTPFGVEQGNFGWGPFIALQPGTDDIIEAIGLGAMFGFRRPGTGTESFNLGFGVVVDPNTRILGDGIVANEPLPEGETVIRYKEEMQTGLLVLASFGF